MEIAKYTLPPEPEVSEFIIRLSDQDVRWIRKDLQFLLQSIEAPCAARSFLNLLKSVVA